MRNRRIIVLLFGLIYTLYIVYIAINIDVLHWLLYAFGNDVFLISITLLLFLPTYIFAIYEGRSKTFIITLSIELLIVWSLRGMFTNADFCNFDSLYSYYKETGVIPYKNFFIIEFCLFFSLWSLFNILYKLNYINNTFSLILFLFCATSMLISGLMNTYSVWLNTKKSCSYYYKIPSEPIYVRLNQKGEYVYVDIESDEDFLNNIVSFRTPIDLVSISFYLLPNDSIYFSPKDSARIEVLSGNVTYQSIPAEEYLLFDFYTSPFSVFKYSKESGILYKRPIPL